MKDELGIDVTPERLQAAVTRLEGELRALLDAFIRHRTTMHEVAPAYCKTCRESDGAIERARALLAE